MVPLLKVSRSECSPQICASRMRSFESATRFSLAVRSLIGVGRRSPIPGDFIIAMIESGCPILDVQAWDDEQVCVFANNNALAERDRDRGNLHVDLLHAPSRSSKGARQFVRIPRPLLVYTARV